jgi:hypothetical protein
MQLLVPSLDYVEVERQPPERFALPTLPISSLLKASGPEDPANLVKIEGAVTYRHGRVCFVQDASGGALALGREEVSLRLTPGSYRWVFYQEIENGDQTGEEQDLQPGDLVQAVGYPESQGYSPVLTEVMFRKVGHAMPVQPVRASLNDIVLGNLDSSLVSMDVVFLGQERADSRLLFELQSGQKVFQALLPIGRETMPEIAPGSRVRVRGVCQVESSPFPELGRVAGTFKLLLSSPADLEVLERAPWWTLKRVVGLVGVLIRKSRNANELRRQSRSSMSNCSRLLVLRAWLMSRPVCCITSATCSTAPTC